MSRGFPNRALPSVMRNGLIEDRLAPPGWFAAALRSALAGLGGAGDRPDKAHHLARNRGGDDGVRLVPRGEGAIAGAQAPLRLPGDVAHRLGQTVLACLHRRRQPRWAAIGPAALDEHSPCAVVAGFGDAALSALGPTRVLAAHHSPNNPSAGVRSGS